MKTLKLRNGMRTVAVGFIAALGLTLSGCFVPIPFPVPVPDTTPPPPLIDAKPGDYESQEVQWSDCGSGFDCAYVAAPMDWNDLDSEAISLYMVRQKALSGNSMGTIFVNPGGPGAGGASFIRDGIDYAVGKDLQKNYDVVGWDPRGVGQSSAVSCLDQEGMDEYLFGDPRPFAELKRGSEEWADAVLEGERAFGEACYKSTGELLGFVDTISTVKDLDLLRQLVGDSQLNYLGFSYGTFIGALYAELFADKAGHLVLDGAIAPDVSLFEVVLMQQKGFEAATRAYLQDCIGKSGCPFTGTVDEAMQEIGKMLAAVDKDPLQADDGRWVSVGTFITAIILPLYNEANWPMLNELFTEMRVGKTSTAQFLADFYYSRAYGFYEDNSTEAFSAINCLDYPAGGDLEQMRNEAEQIAKAAPIFGPYAGYGDLGCQAWPYEGVEKRGPVTGAGANPILIIGTTGDPATPFAWAEQLAEQLESGVLVTYNGEGHGAYTSGNACIDKTVEEYFLHGTVPASDPDC